MPTEPLQDMDMYYEVRGEGEPLLLLHGFTGSGDDWKHVFPVWPDGWRLVIPDLRGHGRSTNRSRQFTFRQSALDVLALLGLPGPGAREGDRDERRGEVPVHMATGHRERLEAMVLVSAAPYYPSEARALMAQIATEGRSEDDWRVMRERHKHGDAQIRDLWTQGRGLKDSYDDMNFTPPLLSTIRARTLIVHGDRDPIYPVRLACRDARLHPGLAPLDRSERRTRPHLRPATGGLRRGGPGLSAGRVVEVNHSAEALRESTSPGRARTKISMGRQQTGQSS